MSQDKARIYDEARRRGASHEEAVAEAEGQQAPQQERVGVWDALKMAARALPFVPSGGSKESDAAARGFVREAAAGASFGATPHIEAALRPGVGIEDVRASRREYAEQYGPMAAAAPYVAGAALGAPARLGAAAMSKVLPQAGTATQLAKLGTIGAVEGGVTGGLEGTGARQGAAFGGVVGLGIPALASVAGAAGRGVSNFVRPNIARNAEEGLADFAQTALQPGQKFSDLPINEGDVAADVLGMEGQLAGKRALRGGPDNMADVARQMEARAAENLQEATEALTRLDVDPVVSRQAHRRAMAETRRARSAAAYSEVYEQEPSPELYATWKAFADEPQAASIIQNVGDIASPIERMESARRSAQKVIESAFRGGNPAPVQNLIRATRQLDEALSAVPGMQDARDVYRTLIRAEQASFLATDPMNSAARGIREAIGARVSPWKSASSADLADTMEQLQKVGGDDAVLEYRHAVLDDLTNLIRDNADAPHRAMDRVMALRDNVRQVFGSEPAEQFYRDLEAIQRQVGTARAAESGIRSAVGKGVQDDQHTMMSLLTMAGYAASKMLGASVRTGLQTFGRAPGRQAAFDKEVLELLFRRDAGDVMQQLDAIAPDLARRQLDRLRRSGAFAGLAAAGSTEGR